MSPDPDNNSRHTDDIKPSFRDLEADVKPVPHEGHLSNSRAVFNMVMTCIGLGILFMPGAMADAGWIGGWVILVIASGTSLFFSHILHRTMYMDPKNPGVLIASFEGIGGVAFGIGGRVVSAATLHVTLALVACVMLIITGNFMHDLAPYFKKSEWIGLSMILILPASLLRNMKEVGIVAAVGIMSVILTAVGIAIGSFVEISNSMTPKYQLFSGTFSKFGGAFAMYMLSFTVTCAAPGIVKEMKRPQDFPKVVNATFILVTSVYGVISTVGYLGFGDRIAGDVCIPTVLSPTWGLFVKVSIVVMVACHYLCLFFPPALAIDNLFGVSHQAGITSRWQGNLFTAELVRMGFRLIFVGVLLVIAIFFPEAGTILSLLGSVTAVLLSVIFPAAFYWRLMYLNGKTVPRGEIALLIVGVCIGLLASTTGLMGTIEKLLYPKPK